MVRTLVRRFALGVTAVGAALASLMSLQGAAAQDAAFKGPDTPVAFIMDASRSMLGEVEGRRRMDVARDAMLQLAPGPLQQGRASLVSFGNDRVNECDTIPLIHPFGADSVNATIAAIQTIEPAEPAPGVQSRIGSPLYRSIEVALETLPADMESGSIVMVTDGVDACDRDICELVPLLNERGVSVDILAIDVNPNLLNQLACVPAGTGGALLPSDNLPTIESYARLLSRAAAPEPIDVQPYLDEIGRLTAELAAMKQERDDLENLRRQLDADLLMVFGELDDANEQIKALKAALARAQSQGADTAALEAELEEARLIIRQLQDRIVALDAAVQRCERELAQAQDRINALESTEPEVVVREVTVTKIEPDPQVLADLNAAKATLDALGCPFDQMDACEPAGNAQDSALLAELDRVRGQLNAARADINTLRADRDAALAGKASADKTVQRMIDGLALTASTYESNAGEGYSWIDAVASNAEAGPGLASVRANRGLMAMVSREQSIQIIPSDTSGLQGEVDALKAQVAALRGNLRDANDTNTGLRGQLNVALGQRDAVAVERDELMALLAGAADRASLLADERDAAAKLAEDRLAEILRLTTALTAQGEDLQALAGDFNSVESQRSGLQRDLEQALLVIDERDATIQSLTLNIETLSTDLGAATNQRDEAISDRDLLLEEIAKLDHTVETLLAKNRELQALMDDLSAEAAQDRTAATEASAAMDTLRIELDQRTEGLAAAQDRSGLLERELAELRVILSQIDGELTDARNSSTAVSEENNSLVVVLQELREDIIAKDQAAQDASSQISTLTVRINELEAAGLENEAFFDILITQCTALLGLEGDGGDALDRETLAYECAAAFESAQRWRADLTEMVELRDRSLQACEARYAALDTRAKTLAAGVCGE